MSRGRRCRNEELFTQQLDMTVRDDSRVKRPFYFIIAIWGERYRNYFLEYCLPSLLAPGNIPALSPDRPSQYLIATTREDWEVMQTTAIFRELERYTVPVFVELPPHPPQRPFWLQAIMGYKICMDMAFRARAYAVYVSPDTIFSDGSIARLQELAVNGAELVLFDPPRLDEKPLFDAFGGMGLLPEASARDSGKPLIFPARQLVAAALKGLHSQTICNEWEAPYFCGYAAMTWWRVPDEEGIIMWNVYWSPVLVDYAAVQEHDSSIFLERSFDGKYFYRNFDRSESIYVIQDSDELFIASWALTAYNPVVLKKRWFGEIDKGATFRSSFYGLIFDSLKRRLFFLPARIHVRPLNDKWEAVEQRALRTLLTWLDKPDNLAAAGRKLSITHKKYNAIEAKIDAHRLPWWRRNPITWALCANGLFPLLASQTQLEKLMADFRAQAMGLMNRVTGVIQIIVNRLGLALCGDKVALRWWGWRLRKLGAGLIGRPFQEPKPPPPE